ncbi:hypothetical protein DPMN_068065 [Dreissena polymorpha]|uniref:Uncharacterized protein n=1 Tax=Dreissena polymorpha TaxID=45954 RepID=A0A9D3Z0X6_DREPO|nr:hypothetical protein DPMN_068065 [Dreissena polymorpha]
MCPTPTPTTTTTEYLSDHARIEYRDNTRFPGHDHLRALEKSVPARVRSTRAGTDIESARR